MIDGSHLPYEENVALTKKVVEYAHQFDVTVEATFWAISFIDTLFISFKFVLRSSSFVFRRVTMCGLLFFQFDFCFHEKDVVRFPHRHQEIDCISFIELRMHKGSV